ncbi:MAG: hypothetical protein JWM68_2309 [Verrucomicrobiales bacterium]|nr:hypothetical protein [Verrucomicrobiales bacterium]
MRITRRHFIGTCAVASAAITPASWAAAETRSLFDGKSLKGWHKPPKKIGHGTGGSWTVEDGLLICEQDPPGSGNGGMLLTDEKFGDFELTIDINPDWGPDTGIFFRCTDEGHGFQMYVDYHQGGNVGHLRGEMPGNFAMKPFQIQATLGADGKPKRFTTEPDPRAAHWPKGVYEYSCGPEEWIKTWRLNDWNTARIRCIGKHPQITTWINGVKICHWNGETCSLPDYNQEKVFSVLGAKGSIGLQVHGGKAAWPAGTKARWRNIRIQGL